MWRSLLMHIIRLLTAIHHMLLLMMRLLMMLRVLLLHMMSHMMVRHGLRTVQRRTPRGTKHTTLGNSSRLQFAARVHYRGLVSIGGGVRPHMHVTGAIGPVPLVSVHLLLLGAVVARVPDVHPIVGRKPGVRHTLRGLPCRRGTAVMVRWDALPQADHGRIATAGIGVRLYCTSTLGHLDSGAIVLVLVRMLRGYHTTISHIRHVRVGEVRTHANDFEITVIHALNVLSFSQYSH